MKDFLVGCNFGIVNGELMLGKILTWNNYYNLSKRFN